MNQSEIDRIRRELLGEDVNTEHKNPFNGKKTSVRESYGHSVGQDSNKQSSDTNFVKYTNYTQNISANQNRFYQEAAATSAPDSEAEETVKRKKRKRRKKKKKHIFLKFILSIVVLVAVIGAIIYAFIHNMIDSNMNCNILDPSKVQVNREISASLAEETADYRTFVLFGVDSREENLTGKTRTDSMMLVSLNKKTKDVKILSVYRDTYLNIGDDVYTKCNAAYAKGGPEQAISMLNQNFDLDIEGYVTIGFIGLIDAIDSLDGITVEVEDNEVQYLNQYVKDMSKELGIENTPIEASGRQTLNGAQAVAYCRIRYTAGDDYKRTQRQRTVLQAMIDKVKDSSVLTTKEAAESIMSGIVTSLSANDLMQMLPLLVSFDITGTDGVPFESYRDSYKIDGQSCVIPETLEDNVKELHKFLYGTENYEPSNTVKTYSAVIAGK